MHDQLIAPAREEEEEQESGQSRPPHPGAKGQSVCRDAATWSTFVSDFGLGLSNRGATEWGIQIRMDAS